MPIVKRFRATEKPVKKGNIIRRNFSDAPKEFADNVEQYVFTLPATPLPFRTLILKWVVPYQEGHFIMFGQKLKLMPQYRTETGIESIVTVTGVMVEITGGPKPKRGIIQGPRGTWHGQIKFFVKKSMGA